MANYRLEYLSLLQNLLDNMSIDSQIEDADDGEKSTVDEGRELVLSNVESCIRELQQFKIDVEILPFKKFQTKYH